MKRNLAFTGFIIATSVFTVMTMCLILAFILIADTIFAIGGSYAPIANTLFFCLELVFSLISLILNAVSISKTRSLEKFKNKLGLIITTLIFNFANLTLWLISMINIGNDFIVYFIPSVLVFIGNLLILIDLFSLPKTLKKIKNINNFDLNKKAQKKNDDLNEFDIPNYYDI